MTVCKVCGSTDSVLWHRFVHEPKICIYPEGIRYSGEVFCLCDRCMADMIDTALSIRRAKDGIFLEETDPSDCISGAGPREDKEAGM